MARPQYDIDCMNIEKDGSSESPYNFEPKHGEILSGTGPRTSPITWRPHGEKSYENQDGSFYSIVLTITIKLLATIAMSVADVPRRINFQFGPIHSCDYITKKIHGAIDL